MRHTFSCLLTGCLLAGCHADTAPTTTQAAPQAPAAALVAVGADVRGIWQLNYYPDSLLANRDIYDNSNWSAPYAYALRLEGDSCELIGWHETWKTPVRQLAPGLYEAGDAEQGWRLRLEASNKLLFKQFGTAVDSAQPWYPFHRVATVLTQEALKKQVARQLFAGRYRVLQGGRPADSLVTLGADQRVRGLRGIGRYDIVTAMDWDFLLPNGFSWQSARGQEIKQYSFEFSGDTLLLRNFEMHPEDDSVPSGILVTTPAWQLLRLRGR